MRSVLAGHAASFTPSGNWWPSEECRLRAMREVGTGRAGNDFQHALASGQWWGRPMG